MSDHIRTIFESLDKNNDGLLSTDDLQHVLGDMSLESVKEIVAQLDTTGDGHLTFDEFSSGFELFLASSSSAVDGGTGSGSNGAGGFGVGGSSSLYSMTRSTSQLLRRSASSLCAAGDDNNNNNNNHNSDEIPENVEHLFISLDTNDDGVIDGDDFRPLFPYANIWELCTFLGMSSPNDTLTLPVFATKFELLIEYGKVHADDGDNRTPSPTPPSASSSSSHPQQRQRRSSRSYALNVLHERHASNVSSDMDSATYRQRTVQHRRVHTFRTLKAILDEENMEDEREAEKIAAYSARRRDSVLDTQDVFGSDVPQAQQVSILRNRLRTLRGQNLQMKHKYHTLSTLGAQIEKENLTLEDERAALTAQVRAKDKTIDAMQEELAEARAELARTAAALTMERQEREQAVSVLSDEQNHQQNTKSVLTRTRDELARARHTAVRTRAVLAVSRAVWSERLEAQRTRLVASETLVQKLAADNKRLADENESVHNELYVANSIIEALQAQPAADNNGGARARGVSLADEMKRPTTLARGRSDVSLKESRESLVSVASVEEVDQLRRRWRVKMIMNRLLAERRRRRLVQAQFVDVVQRGRIQNLKDLVAELRARNLELESAVMVGTSGGGGGVSCGTNTMVGTNTRSTSIGGLSSASAARSMDSIMMLGASGTTVPPLLVTPLSVELDADTWLELRAYAAYFNVCLRGVEDVKHLLPIDTESPAEMLTKIRDGWLLACFLNAARPDTVDMRVLNGTFANTVAMEENLTLVIESCRTLGIQVKITTNTLLNAYDHVKAATTFIYEVIQAQLLLRVNVRDHFELTAVVNDHYSNSNEDGHHDASSQAPQQLLLWWLNYHVRGALRNEGVQSLVSGHGVLLNDSFAVDANPHLRDTWCWALLLHVLNPQAMTIDMLRQHIQRTSPASSPPSSLQLDILMAASQNIGVPIGATFVCDEVLECGGRTAQRCAILYTAAIFKWFGSGIVLNANNNSNQQQQKPQSPLLSSVSSSSSTALMAKISSQQMMMAVDESSFVMWINSLNARTPDGEYVFVRNLLNECRDGLMLLSVLDKLVPGIVDWQHRVETRPKNKFHMIGNCNYAIELAVAPPFSFSLVGISGNDMCNGNEKFVMALVWQMMHYQIVSLYARVAADRVSKTDVDKHLIAAANTMITQAHANAALSSSSSSRGAMFDAPYAMLSSFHDASLSNSFYFLHLLWSLRPSNSVNWHLVTAGVSTKEKLMNARYAINVARKLGCTIFVSPEQLVNVNAKMVSTFIASVVYVMQRTTQQLQQHQQQHHQQQQQQQQYQVESSVSIQGA